jgi:hypothetical protein
VVRTARALLGALGLGAAAAAPAQAALVPMAFTVEVLSVDPGVTAVAVGDRFDIALAIDDTAIDDLGLSGVGHFPGLLTSFVMTSDPANTGSWQASGSFDLAASNFVTNANGDAFTFQLVGTGFPDGGPGLPFLDVDIDFTYAAAISDTGTGQTFADQFDAGFDPALADVGTGRIRFQPAPGQLPSAHFDTPEPGSAALLLAAALVVGLRHENRSCRSSTRSTPPRR